MNKQSMVWFGRYEGWLKWLARGVRDHDKECILKAGQLFDLMLPSRCIVVPMPSHLGDARQMLEVASRMPGRRFVMDALTCEPHEPSYAQKKEGFAPYDFEMEFLTGALEGAPEEDFAGGVYVIDNVVATGVTASAARRAVERRGLDATVCALAYSPWR